MLARNFQDPYHQITQSRSPPLEPSAPPQRWDSASGGCVKARNKDLADGVEESWSYCFLGEWGTKPRDFIV